MKQIIAQGYVTESLESIIFFLFIAFVINFYAYSKQFFILPSEPIRGKNNRPKAIEIATCFGIYFGISLFFSRSLLYALQFFFSHFFESSASTAELLSFVQLTCSVVTLISLLWYSIKRKKGLLASISRDRAIEDSSSHIKNFFLGSCVWILGFPTVAAVGQLCDLITYFFFGMQTYEQVAVRYLKMTLGSMPMLFVALFSIIIAAPLIEEFLFRGMLQSFLKERLGPKAAILLSSLAFALFHTAASQGLGNISLVISLFSFAIYLGFVYEKRGSLLASIGLHMTFNTISTVRILFFS